MIRITTRTIAFANAWLLLRTPAAELRVTDAVVLELLASPHVTHTIHIDTEFVSSRTIRFVVNEARVLELDPMDGTLTEL